MNPQWMQYLYLSSLVVQSFDTAAFITLKFFPTYTNPKSRQLQLTPYARFATRAYATLLFPFILLCYRLRKNHIRDTEVGQTVGLAFAMFHGFAFAAYGWMAYTKSVKDRFRIEPFRVVMGVHGTWTAWAICGFLWA